MKIISSVNNPRLKNAVRLKSSRGRQKQRQTIIFGWREIERARQSDFPIVEVFVSDSFPFDLHASEFEAMKNEGVQVFRLPEDLISRIEFGDRSDGVVAIAERPNRFLSQLTIPECPLVVVMESIEKPGNLGAVLRTADAIQADAVIVADPMTDLFHPNCIRASMGCVFGMATAQDTTENVFEWLQQKGLNLFAAVVDGENRYDQVSFVGPSAILLGNEANGLSEKWSLLDRHATRKINRITLPMMGIADSLNVSTTAAVLCYEARRQRGFNPEI